MLPSMDDNFSNAYNHTASLEETIQRLEGQMVVQATLRAELAQTYALLAIADELSGIRKRLPEA